MIKEQKHFAINLISYHIISGFVLLVLFFVLSGQTFADTRTQAKRMHDRLTGVVPSANILDQMESLIDSNDAVGAAFLAMENKHFYNSTLVNLITPWTNEAQAVFPEDMETEGTLNDYTATVIGIVRDEDDFRKILYDDVLYIGNNSLISTPYSYSSNAHYQELENSGLNLGYVDSNDSSNNVLRKVSQASRTGGILDSTQTAGVMTTRAAAKAFFVDGTNRAMFRFTVLNHLCKDLEQVKDVTLPSDRIRQDVSRSPGGDSRIFMNACIGCHAGMDPMAQAFAYYDYDKSAQRLDFTNGQVKTKNLINADNFKPGYIITNDNWANYWREGENSRLGWDATLPGNGSGMKSMARELAHSKQFARCQVEKVFKTVCLHPPSNKVERDYVTNTLIPNFVANDSYNLKQVFADTAVYCKGP